MLRAWTVRRPERHRRRSAESGPAGGWVAGASRGGDSDGARHPARQQAGAEGHLGQRPSKMCKRIPEEHSDVGPARAGDTPTR